MPNFTAETFLDTAITSANETTFPVIPEGDFPAYVESINVVEKTSKNGDPLIIMEVQWIITDADVQQAVNNAEPKSKQSLFLDFTPEGGLDFGEGKNIQLGRLREALNQNHEGKAWRPLDMIGASATIHVRHRQYNEDTFSEVKKVSAAG